MKKTLHVLSLGAGMGMFTLAGNMLAHQNPATYVAFLFAFWFLFVSILTED